MEGKEEEAAGCRIRGKEIESRANLCQGERPRVGRSAVRPFVSIHLTPRDSKLSQYFARARTAAIYVVLRLTCYTWRIEMVRTKHE